MFHTQSLKTLAGLVVLMVLVPAIGNLLSTTVTSADSPAPTCGISTIITTGPLSASELYYAQQAERFMTHDSCSAQSGSGVLAGGLICAQPAFSVEQAWHALSTSEAYYAQRAQRFSSCNYANDTGGLPQ